MARWGIAALTSLTLGACAQPRENPPSICQLFPDANCGSNSPPPNVGSGGGQTGNGSDASAQLGDASGDGGLVQVVGAVVVANSVPLGIGADASTPAAGWVVAPALSSGTPETTDTLGGFALSDLALYQGGIVLAATPPAGTSALGALGAFASSGTAVTLVAVGQNTLEEVALTAAIAIDARGTATVIIQLQGSGASVTGVTFNPTVAMSGANVAYDDPSGTLRAGTQTNALGTIGVFNVPAPTGVTLESVTLGHAGRTVSYAAPVARGMVTWLSVAPP